MLDMHVRRKQGDFTVDVAITQTEMGVTALFGPSGAGKTSIINMLAGLLRPDAGHIRIDGRCLFDAEKGIDLPVHRRQIGYVFQDGRLLPHLSVRANLNFGLKLTPPARRYIAFRRRKATGGHRPRPFNQPAAFAHGRTPGLPG
jgi:molybdate transport system ATP-binding protein